MSKKQKEFEILDFDTDRRRKVNIGILAAGGTVVLGALVTIIILICKGGLRGDGPEKDVLTIAVTESTKKKYEEDAVVDVKHPADKDADDVQEAADNSGDVPAGQMLSKTGTDAAAETEGRAAASGTDSGSESTVNSYGGNSGISNYTGGSGGKGYGSGAESRGSKNRTPEDKDETDGEPRIRTDENRKDWQNEWAEGEAEVNKVLEEEAKYTQVGINYEELIESLEAQIAKKQKFIEDHYGWPADYGDNGQYDGVREYIDSIHRSFLSGKIDYTADGKGLYGEEVETLQKQLLFHLFKEQQYYTGYPNCPEATDIYIEWAKFGLKDIGRIESVKVLPYQYPVECEDYTICMEIEAETEDGSYMIYVGDMDVEDAERGYIIMDIEKLEDGKETTATEN